MPNRNYVKGRAFEYRVKKFLESKGYFVMRAYGSKGLFDLVGIPPPATHEKAFNFPYLIQCKTNGYIKPKERKLLKAAIPRYQATIILATKDKKGHIVFKGIE